MSNFDSNIYGEIVINQRTRGVFEKLFSHLESRTLTLTTIKESKHTVEYSFEGDIGESYETGGNQWEIVLKYLPLFSVKKTTISETSTHGGRPDGDYEYTIVPNKNVKCVRHESSVDDEN